MQTEQKAPADSTLRKEIEGLIYWMDCESRNLKGRTHDQLLQEVCDSVEEMCDRERQNAVKEAFDKLDMPQPKESDYRIAGESSTEFMDTRAGGQYDGQLAMWYGFQEKKVMVLAEMFPSRP